MAMDVAVTAGKKGRPRPEMNVTPLVDVVLVLLIVFMVLTAAMKEHFWIHVPEKAAQQQNDDDTASDEELPIVITVSPQGQIQINQEGYPDREFPEHLRRMLVARGDRRVYFDADDAVPYARAMQVMDLARGGGATHIAVVTEKLEE